jgi:hypothetical protein
MQYLAATAQPLTWCACALQSVDCRNDGVQPDGQHHSKHYWRLHSSQGQRAVLAPGIVRATDWQGVLVPEHEARL